MLLRSFLTLSYRLLLVLALYTFCRFVFLLSNFDTFKEIDTSVILLSFIHGFRFDWSIIISSNLAYILLELLSFVKSTRVWEKVKKCFFVVTNTLLLFMNLADVEYFKFTAKRTGYEVIGILGDVQAQSLQLSLYYWYIPLLVLLLCYLLWRMYDAKFINTDKFIIKKYVLIIFPLVVTLCVISIRGGWQYKPLQPDHAFVLQPYITGNLVLNTPYNFFTTLTYPDAEEVFYYTSKKDVLLNLPTANQVGSVNFNAPKDNVVLIILESFSREYMSLGKPDGKGYTPFLDSLAKVSTFMDHHFANGKRSIEAVPSIFASLPSLMNESYITSIYQANELYGMPEALAHQGYHTAFFHGGRNGTMGFDKFALHAGFKEYYGLDEYPDDENDFDGNWGVSDGPYLCYFANQITTFKSPFLASVFTLSSHQPYSIPANKKGVFPKGTLDIHESIGYVDDALRNFFAIASTKEWYKNTLFVITADHTQQLETPQYRNSIGDYRVPLLFFHPSKKINIDTSLVSQHADIMPTVLHYCGSKRPSILFGQNLFTTKEGSAYYYSNNTYFYIKKGFFITFDKAISRLYHSSDVRMEKEISDKPLVKQKMETELKAYLQYYFDGLRANSTYSYNLP